MKDLLREVALHKMTRLDGRTLTGVLTRHCIVHPFVLGRLYLYGMVITCDSEHIYMSSPDGEIRFCFANPPHFYFNVVRHAIGISPISSLGIEGFVREMCDLITKEAK